MGESLPAEAIHPRCHDRGHCSAWHTAYCTRQVTLHIAVTAVHCILHTAYCILHTAHCTLDTMNYAMPTLSQKGTLHTAHQETIHCSAVHYTVCPLHIRTTEDTGLQQDQLKHKLMSTVKNWNPHQEASTCTSSQGSALYWVEQHCKALRCWGHT